MNGAEILTRFTADTTQVDKATKNYTSGISGLTKAFTLSSLAAQGVSKAISVISQNMDNAISRFDTMNNFPKVMSNLGISAEESNKVIDDLSEKLKGLPTALDKAALSVQRLTTKTGNVEEAEKIFLALNNAILAGGASTDIQASALEQLSQSYSKGKMDMMEWRTIQMAMPAQLKQVAQAMGVSTDELGEMLREGKNTDKVIDDFMDTIIKLNKNGINGFASFEKQARNSTGGIRTAVTVAKTQVVKGVADMIGGINKSLKKSNLGS
jgi:tape measure domain-containing protein